VRRRSVQAHLTSAGERTAAIGSLYGRHIPLEADQHGEGRRRAGPRHRRTTCLGQMRLPCRSEWPALCNLPVQGTLPPVSVTHVILAIAAGGTLLVAALILVQTFRLGAPPMPSNRRIRHAVSHLVATELVNAGRRNTRIVELGSGWGGLTRRLAAEQPGVPVVGVERSVIPLLWSVAIQRVRGPVNARFRYGDVVETGLAGLLGGPTRDGPARGRPATPAEQGSETAGRTIGGRTILVSYLSSEHMKRIGHRIAERPLPHEVVLISAAFALYPYEPDRVETLDDLYRTPVYVYRLGAAR